MSAKRKLTIIRAYTDMGTFGKLYFNGEFIGYTVEKPWRNNEKNVSCIPEGEYLIEPHKSPKHGKCYILTCESLGVTKYGPSQRTHILLHAANHEGQLEGCIAPGKSLGCVAGNWAVTQSELMLSMIKSLLGENSGTLRIGSQ